MRLSPDLSEMFTGGCCCWKVWFRFEGTGLRGGGGGGRGGGGSAASPWPTGAGPVRSMGGGALGCDPSVRTLSFAYVSGGRSFSCTGTCFL